MNENAKAYSKAISQTNFLIIKVIGVLESFRLGFQMEF